MKYEPETAIEMLLDAWKDEQEDSMRRYLNDRTRGDLVASIYFHYDWDNGEYFVRVYPSDEEYHCIELPRYGNFTEKELVEAILDAWYSDPEEDTINLGGKVYSFQKA